MKFVIDKSLGELGIKSVVIGIAKNVKSSRRTVSLISKKRKKEMEDWALACDLDEVLESPVVQGYVEILQRVGRSVKKNPPTVPALIRNIQHRGFAPSY